MHLFFIDQYISFDMMAPIIYKLSKKKRRVYLYNFNKVQSLNKIKLYNFIIEQKNIFEAKDLIHVFSKKYFFLIFLNLLLLMPSFILKRGYKFWKFIWEDINFISKDLLIKFIRKNNIKTISYDESLVEKKKKFINSISKDLNIPIIMNHGGLYTLKTTTKKKSINKFKESNFFLSPNKYPIYFYNFKKKYLKSNKYNQLGSPRFDIEWLNLLKNINFHQKKKKNDKIKIAFFIRPTSISNTRVLNLLKELKKINNIEIKINYKPRDVLPTKCSNLQKSDMNSSELILWSDLIISYASSIILEGISRNKPLIYLDYLQINTKEDISWFDNFAGIKKARNSTEAIKLIMNFKKNRSNLIIKNSKKKIILNNFISNKSGKGILNKYYSFYEGLIK